MGFFIFISGPEIFLVVLIALLLFGANKMPELAKGIGKGMREFKKATDEIKREIESSTADIRKDIKDTTDDIKKDINV
jgi:sec-independent protein translocase protein TatA